ncbi:hypothetical protein ACU4GA_32515 [Methylobacterium oryzae CBMB20]
MRPSLLATLGSAARRLPARVRGAGRSRRPREASRARPRRAGCPRPFRPRPSSRASLARDRPRRSRTSPTRTAGPARALNEPGERSGIPKALRSSGSKAGGPANDLNPSGKAEAPAPPKGDLGRVIAGKELFHGNYCGKGQRGEGLPPTDALDAACMRHDACYVAAGYRSCGCDARAEARGLRRPRTARTRRWKCGAGR